MSEILIKGIDTSGKLYSAGNGDLAEHFRAILTEGKPDTVEILADVDDGKMRVKHVKQVIRVARIPLDTN